MAYCILYIVGYETIMRLGEFTMTTISDYEGLSDDAVLAEFDSLLSDDDGEILDRLETRDLSDADFLELSDEEGMFT